MINKNLGIHWRPWDKHHRPSGENDRGGNWVVSGKLTGYYYYTGSKFECTKAISKNPQWYQDEIDLYNDRRMEEYYEEYPGVDFSCPIY